MATDATFEKIQRIVPHGNADALEIAVVSNFPCVVKKGEFKAGDWCFYIRDDAALTEYARKKEYDARASLPPDVMAPCDCYTPVFAWQEPLLGYLGGGGRVKTIKLRGKVSMGILLRPEAVLGGAAVSDEVLEDLNSKIRDEETGPAYLEKRFGIVHYVAPSGNMGDMDVKFCGLPEGLSVSDEENWENVPEEDLHLGRKALVTKKLDGCSCTVTCYPDGRYEVSGRRNTFAVERMKEKGEENVYTRYTAEAVKAGLWWAKAHGQVIALRGEVCCSSVQRSSYNQDCQRNNFFVYGVNFPQSAPGMSWFERNGCYGTKYHFVKVAEEMAEAGYGVKTVPVLSEETVTRELLKKYNDQPWSVGEGVVLNVDVAGVATDEFGNPESTVWHYKSKSREYLMKMK